MNVIVILDLILSSRWTHVVADHVEGRYKTFKVIFVATSDGSIRKMIHLQNQTEACLIEDIKIVPNGEHNPVKQMTISKQHVSHSQENVQHS